MKLFRIKFMTLCVLVLLCTVGQGIAKAAVSDVKTNMFKKKTYAYKEVSGHEILADVFVPEGKGKFPVVIYAHGGGFVFGNRQGLRVPLRDKLLEAGFVAVSIDYRLAPETKIKDIIEDVKDACHWVRNKGPQLFNADPNRIAIGGGSAGGYLAFMAAANVKPRLNGVFLVSAPVGDYTHIKKCPDKEPLMKKGTPYDYVRDDIISEGDYSGRMVLNRYLANTGLALSEIFGFDPAVEPERLTPFQPANIIDDNFPNTLLVYSEGDTRVPISEAEKYKELLSQQGVENKLFTVGHGHSSEIIRNCPGAVEEIVSFLGNQFIDPQKQIAIDRDLSFREVQKGVYVIRHAFPYGCNSLVVEMPDDHLLLVDTPLTPEATKTVLDWFTDKLGKQKITVINTGFHWDNLGGNEYLIQQKIPIYGSKLTAKLVKEKANQSHAKTILQLSTPERKRFSNALKKLNFTPPTHLYKLAEGLELQFGSERVQVYYFGPSHAKDNVAVHFPSRKVLFAGCMISGWGGIGNTDDANMKAWPDSIRKLKQFDIDILVPGHGQNLLPDLIDENIKLLEKENSK